MLKQVSLITRLFGGFLAAVLLTTAVGSATFARTHSITSDSKTDGETVERTQPLTDLQNYVGAQHRSRTDCALVLAGAGLGLCAAAIAGAVTLGAGAFVIGTAVAGAVVPLFAGFC